MGRKDSVLQHLEVKQDRSGMTKKVQSPGPKSMAFAQPEVFAVLNEQGDDDLCDFVHVNLLLFRIFEVEGGVTEVIAGSKMALVEYLLGRISLQVEGKTGLRQSSSAFYACQAGSSGAAKFRF